jgi:predicted ATP-dependent Lon-type protease
MTSAREPDDRGLDRTLRSFVRVASALPNRRISRLEDTQVTWRELNGAFDRVYEEIDELKVEMNQRFDAQDAKIDNLGIELNGKLDLILRRLTGMGQGNE